MTPDQLAAIAARLRTATRGPWKTESVWTDKHSGADIIRGATGQVICTCDEHDGGLGGGERNIDFLQHAPTDIAALLAEVARLRAGANEILDEHEKDLEALHKTRADLARANAAFASYGRHDNGCSADIGATYICKCGYDETLREHLAMQGLK